jgi:hypothetical protein
MNKKLTRPEIYGAIDAERKRQDAKWGYPRNDHSATDWLAILAEEVGEAAEQSLRVLFDDEHPEEFVRELIHTAAVAVCAIEHFGRGGTREEQADE